MITNSNHIAGCIFRVFGVSQEFLISPPRRSETALPSLQGSRFASKRDPTQHSTLDAIIRAIIALAENPTWHGRRLSHN